MDTGSMLSARIWFFALPGAFFIKKYTYKSGILLGLGMYAAGAFMFYPAMILSASTVSLGFMLFLLAIVILFAGLSILELQPTHMFVLSVRRRQPHRDLILLSHLILLAQLQVW
jgi:fucose permease